MNRTCFALLLALCFTTVVELQAQSGYRQATDAQQKEIVAKMTQMASTMKTMQCDFVQVKVLSFMDEKVQSEGKMYFKAPDKIRWEYTKPYSYMFAMDGTHVRMTSGDRATAMPVKSSKLFSEISRVMIGGVSGKGLVGTTDFTAQFAVGNQDYRIVLTPLKKEVKALFASVVLYAGKADGRIRAVELVEKSGDKTTIRLTNQRLNATIADHVFSL